MDYLWSPWRFRYVSEADKATAVCVLQNGERGSRARSREPHPAPRRANFVVLNLFPYTTAHALVVPYAHVADLPKVQKDTLVEMMALAQKLNAAIEAMYHPDGYNLGMNLGKAAGAGVADHLHLHFLPRWAGSANFVTVIGETRVLPEELITTYDKLAPFFRE